MLFNIFKSKSKPSAPKTAKGRGTSRVKHRQDARMRTEKITVDQLRIGMFVRELDIPWEQSTFMFQGVEIKSQQDILDVQRQCQHVWVDYTEYRLADTPEEASTGSSAFNGKRSLLEVEEAYPKAKEAHKETQAVVTQLFSDMRLGGEIDVDRVKQSIHTSVESIKRNPDASIWLTRLHEKDNLTAQHVLNVAALSIITGRALNLSQSALENLGVCALMHDIGKTLLPLELINRRGGECNDVERGLLRTHPQLGHDILSKTKNMYEGAAAVALTHHEHVDGSGYPRNLKGDDIPEFARIIAIANAYDNLTSTLINPDAISPTEALDHLYAQRGKQFDDRLVLKFIDGISIFPPGSIVEMTNGEVGIVLSTTQEKLNPRVIIILDSAKDATAQQMVDLSQMHADANGEPYRIKTTLADGSYGIVVDEFQRAGLRLG